MVFSLVHHDFHPWSSIPKTVTFHSPVWLPIAIIIYLSAYLLRCRMCLGSVQSLYIVLIDTVPRYDIQYRVTLHRNHNQSCTNDMYKCNCPCLHHHSCLSVCPGLEPLRCVINTIINPRYTCVHFITPLWLLLRVDRLSFSDSTYFQFEVEHCYM